MAKIEHYKDWGSGFSTRLALKYMKQKPGGNWLFGFDDHILKDITSGEIITTFRFDPKKNFTEGCRLYRPDLLLNIPIFQMRLSTICGKDFSGSDYEYAKLNFQFFQNVFILRDREGFTPILEPEPGKVSGKGGLYYQFFNRGAIKFSVPIRWGTLGGILGGIVGGRKFLLRFWEHNLKGGYNTRGDPC